MVRIRTRDSKSKLNNFFPKMKQKIENFHENPNKKFLEKISEKFNNFQQFVQKIFW